MGQRRGLDAARSELPLPRADAEPKEIRLLAGFYPPVRAAPVGLRPITPAARKDQLQMLTRHAATPANVSRRATAMRRQRRRTNNSRLYCGTNGCTSFLVPDPATGVARCVICGYSRRLH